MRPRLSGILTGLIFLVGLGIFAYPTVSNQWNKHHQSRAIARYEEAVEEMDEEDFEELWAKARAYNDKITWNTFAGDVFSREKEASLRGTEYWSVLNTQDNGIMGYLSIPEIGQKLPIYHGTSDGVLQIAIGHMPGTCLPIGGENTHCVVAAHRGLPSARLFTDVDQLQEGDKFYAHILDKVLAYQADQILPMVDKDDLETLTGALQIEEGQDYMSLFTCTPYGVNSHRLLVRGHRVEYHGEDDDKDITPAESMVQAVKNYYMLYLLAAAAVILLLAGIVKLRKRLTRKERR